jgi:hypothetical protein
MRTALYRHYDACGRLLYVGVSLSAVQRLIQHRQAPWAGEIADVKVEYFDSREAALRAEANAIKAEGPVHNLAQTTRAKRPRGKVAPVFHFLAVPQRVREVIETIGREESRSWAQQARHVLERYAAQKTDMR